MSTTLDDFDWDSYNFEPQCEGVPVESHNHKAEYYVQLTCTEKDTKVVYAFCGTYAAQVGTSTYTVICPVCKNTVVSKEAYTIIQKLT